MKNTASIQKNNEMDMKVRGMYGSTVNGVDRSFGSSRTRTRVRAKIHPGEAGIVSGHRIRIDTPSRPMLQSIGRLLTLRGILLFLISGLAIAAAVILMVFNFEYATVYGNTKYSQEQIESFITRGYLGENTFVMAMKYHHRKVSGIPFVDQIDIDIVNPSTVRVNIAEKPTDGCIFYKGSNVYISKDGIIQTVSGRTVEETTVINGVVLTHSNTDSPVQAKNQFGLDLSLELLRAADKYGIRADSIDVDQKNSLTVTFGDVKVLVGKSGYDEKMYKMHQILPYLEGRSGVISMIGYQDGDSSSDNIVLSPTLSNESIEGAEAAEKAQAGSESTAEAAEEITEETEEETEEVKEETEESEAKDAAKEKKEEMDAENASKEKVSESEAAGAAEEKADPEAEQKTEEKTDQTTEEQTENKSEGSGGAEAQKTEKEAAAQSEGKTETEAPAAAQAEKKAEEPAAAQTEKKAEEPAATQTEKKAEEPAAAQTEKKAEEPAAAQTEKKAEEPAATQTDSSKTQAET